MARPVARDMATPLSATTGPDGLVKLDYLAGGHQLVAVRVTAASIGTQVLELIECPGDAQVEPITIQLKPTSHLDGHVRNQSGEPVPGQVVEVWPGEEAGCQQVSSASRTAPFRLPLMDRSGRPTICSWDRISGGRPSPGFEPVLSKWITIREEPRVLLPFIQRPLRTISGRVVDRQGKPLANVEVFQSGDGPERTATRTEGRDGSRWGVFARGRSFSLHAEGFRFFGRLIKPGEGETTVELTRIGEQPTREMRMLPDPIPLEESRGLRGG